MKARKEIENIFSQNILETIRDKSNYIKKKEKK